MAQKPNEKHFAYKAIGLAPVSAAAHRVGNALIDHFNRKTGQCDPSVDRLAALLNIDSKTVKTATAQLCEIGLFKKSSHGGYGHRASYTPQWDEYTRLVHLWDAKMRGEAKPVNGAKTPPSDEGENGAKTPSSTGRKRPFKGGENAPQTLSSNPSYKPIRPSQASFSTAENVVLMRSEQALHGLLRGRERQSPSRSLVAMEQAGKRWELEMRNRCGSVDAYACFLEWITEDVSEMATVAEMRRRGGGAEYLVARMHAAGLTVSG